LIVDNALNSDCSCYIIEGSVEIVKQISNLEKEDVEK